MSFQVLPVTSIPDLFRHTHHSTDACIFCSIFLFDNQVLPLDHHLGRRLRNSSAVWNEYLSWSSVMATPLRVFKVASRKGKYSHVLCPFFLGGLTATPHGLRSSHSAHSTSIASRSSDICKMSDKIKSLTSTDWWKKHAALPQPEGPTSPKTLQIVLSLFNPRWKAILDGIPHEPFVFHELAAYLVDVEKSTTDDTSANLSLTPTVPIVLPDLFGLGSNQVESFICTVFAKEYKIILNARVQDVAAPLLTFTFLAKYPLQIYLNQTGYTGDHLTIPLFHLLRSMVGAEIALSYLAQLPSVFCQELKFPELLVDVEQTTVESEQSIYGVDVSSAKLHVIPEVFNIELGGVALKAKSAFLSLQRASRGLDIDYLFTLSGSFAIVVDANEILFTTTLSETASETFNFELRATNGSSLSNMFSALKLGTGEAPIIPFVEEGSSPTLTDTFATIGCTFMQASPGMRSPFYLDNIFFELELVQEKPWGSFLPKQLHPVRFSVSALMQR